MKRIPRVVPTLAAAMALVACPVPALAQGADAPSTPDDQTTTDKAAATGKASTTGVPAAPEESILTESPPAGATDAAAPAASTNKEEDTSTFGAELVALMGVSASWHGYGDVRFRVNPSGDQVGEESVSDFEASANPILTARMGQAFSAEVELELGTDSGIAAEYYIVDYTVAPTFTLRAGKFIAPIGRYNEVLHPTFRWDMISKPLMFEEVIPTTWTPVGVQVRGTATLAVGSALEYAAYVCNGFSGEADFRQADAILDTIHDVLQDSNDDKAVGARVGLSFLRGQDVGETRIGLSGYTGAVDPAASQRLTIVDLDMRVKLGRGLIRAEVAQSFLGPDRSFATAFERGAYLEASLTFGKVDLAARYDYAATRPQGGPLATEQRLAVSFKYAPSTFWSLRAEADEPIADAGGNTIPDLLASIAFSF